MPHTARRLRARAEQLAAPLPPLLVAAERVAATVAQGVHGRRRVGQGETFWQFRDYETGDTPQSIDWRQSGKSDRVFVREMEWEAAQSLWLWRDSSASMNWHSQPGLATKRERAELLLVSLAALLVRAGEHVALLGGTHPPSAGRGTLSTMAMQLGREPAAPGAADQPAGEEAAAAASLPPAVALPRHAEVVLFSDFLGPLDQLQQCFAHYAAAGVHGHIVQILDPAEETLPYHGRVRFEGLEGEGPWLLSRVEAVRGAYKEKLAAQRDALLSITSSCGWRMTQHRTDHPPESALMALYAGLSLPKEAF